jgi:uncharacterized protein
VRRIRRHGVCAIAAVWPVVALSESAPPIAPPVEQVTADCTAPTYATDRLVCADPELRALDAELAHLWAGAQAAGRVAASAQSVQAAWFRRRSLCAFHDDHRGCVEGAYRARIAELRRIADG